MDAESYGLEMPQEPLTMGEDLRRRILANLKQFDRREHNHEELTRAAVALIITSDPHGDPSFVITRRSAKLKKAESTASRSCCCVSWFPVAVCLYVFKFLYMP